MSKSLEAQGVTITVVVVVNAEEYISLTDIAKFKNALHADDVVKNWLRNRNSVELLGFWETIHNPNFKPVEFDGFRKEAGLNSFVLSPKKWIDTTGANKHFTKYG